MLDLPPLKILFEDDHILVVFKPHRVPVQTDETGHPTLFAQICVWLKEQSKSSERVYLGMVHRLDRAAAGLLVFAKNSGTTTDLSAQFRERIIGKIYEALVEGTPKNPIGHLVHYLSYPADGPTTISEAQIPGAKRAELEYQVLESYEKNSLVRIKLLTGRRHQIRAQIAEIGYPLLGDGRYGATTPYLPGSIALVAQELHFRHPHTKLEMQFHLPLELSSIRNFWRELPSSKL